MKQKLLLLLALVALSFADRGETAAGAATATLTLSPSSGEAPSVSGTISGSGWCVPANPGYPRLTGRGVTGSVNLVPLRGGGALLVGNFAVDGAPGQSIEVTVTNQCPAPPSSVALPPINESATATFTFNPATPTPTPASLPPTWTPVPATVPTSTPTAASLPTWTPTAAVAPSAPSPTPTPAEEPPPDELPPPVGSSSMTLTFTGCKPSKDQIELEFLPLHLVGEDATGVPTGPAVNVPAKKKSGDPQSYVFDSPVAEAGRQFAVTSKTGDPACALKAQNNGQPWTAGKAIEVEIPVPGNTSLEGCKLIDKNPCEDIVVKGAFVRRGEEVQAPPATAPEGAWVLELAYYAGELKTRNQRFRWAVDVTDIRDVRLQASVLPFPKVKEDDYLSPPGLVASWDVHFEKDCGNCEFVVPLKALDTTPDKGKSLISKAGDVAVAPFKLAGKGIKSVFGGGKKKSGEAIKAGNPVVPKTKPGDYLVGGQANPLLQPTTYYFRVVPLKDDGLGAAPSNSVVLQQVAKPPEVKIPITPTPVPVVPSYEVKIISYNGIIPPLNPKKNCYVVTQEAWLMDGFGHFTTDPAKKINNFSVKPGQLICEPEPDEPSIIEVIVSWAEATVDWASEAWQDVKDFAIEAAMKYTGFGASCGQLEGSVLPKGACETALKVALDAALASMGIPPDIPNFDQLMDEGVEYLAAQTAAQAGIPPEVIKAATEEGGPYAGLALEVAEAKLREEMQKEIEANLQDAVTQIQLGYAKQVGFVPDGIPVRPDDYQPPGMTVRVTRKAGVPGGEKGCQLNVTDFVTIPAQTIASPPPGWESAINGLPTKLSPLINYDFFINEADVASGQYQGIDKSLYVPPLAPGDHFDIPMTFKPNYYKSGFHPFGGVSTDDFILAWQIMHEFGNVTMSAGGTCGADKLTLPAKAITVTAEIVGP